MTPTPAPKATHDRAAKAICDKKRVGYQRHHRTIDEECGQRRIAFVWLILSLLSKDYNGVRAALSHPIPAIAMTRFVLVGIYHMQIGMRSIILDYVHGHAKDWALMANVSFAATLALTCVYAVMRIGFA